jgi:apolipoprotein N-acyltransferase
VSTGAFRSGAILTSAVLFALYAGLELPWAWLGWVALVPWLAALGRERSMLAAIGSGAAMSMAFTVAVFAWFAEAFARYTQTPPWLAYALLLVAAPVLQPQFMVFAGVRRGLSARGANGLTASAAAAFAWVGAERLFPRLLGDTLGHGLYPFATFRQGADLAGASGLTFLILLVNEHVYVAGARLRDSPRQALSSLATAAALMCALASYGTLRLHWTAASEASYAPLTAVLVQASLGDYDELRARVGSFAAVRDILEAHMRLSRLALARTAPARPVDLVVWPETVYPTTFGAPKSATGADLDAEIVRFAERTGVPLLFGTYDRDTGGEYNAAVLLEPQADGAPGLSVYRKRLLFPLTETVPPWLDSTRLRDHLPWLGTWRPGGGPPLLKLHQSGEDHVALAPLICLDAVDPGLALDAARHGAELILTLSNDGWFAEGRGARMHLTVSAFRSVETRLPQLRATNTGISASIAANGEIVSRTEIGRSTALTATVTPGRRGLTLMTRWGDWFGPAACVLAPLVSLLAVRFHRPPRGQRSQ